MGRVRDCCGNRHATRIRRKLLTTAIRGGERVTKVGRRHGLRLKWPRFWRGDKRYTLRPQSINTALSIRRHGGIRTHNENFCHELINYAVRIVSVLLTNLRKIETKNFSFSILELEKQFKAPCAMVRSAINKCQIKSENSLTKKFVKNTLDKYLWKV